MGSIVRAIRSGSKPPPYGIVIGLFVVPHASGLLDRYVRKFSPFFLAPRAQKEPKTPQDHFASVEATKGAALGARKLLKKFDQNFSKKGESLLAPSHRVRHASLRRDAADQASALQKQSPLHRALPVPFTQGIQHAAQRLERGMAAGLPLSFKHT